MRLPLLLLAMGIFGTQAVGPALAQIKHVEVGITPTCPYGCWPGAIAALRTLDNVADVSSSPDADRLTITVLLKDQGALPDTAAWEQQFTSIVHKAYIFRGVGMTIEGEIVERHGSILLKISGNDQTILLSRFEQDVGEPSRAHLATLPCSRPEEVYDLLQSSVSAGSKISVTGRLVNVARTPTLQIRDWKPCN